MKKREANAKPNAAESFINSTCSHSNPSASHQLHRMRIAVPTGKRLDLPQDLRLPNRHTPGSQWNCSQTIPCNFRRARVFVNTPRRLQPHLKQIHHLCNVDHIDHIQQSSTCSPRVLLIPSLRRLSFSAQLLRVSLPSSFQASELNTKWIPPNEPIRFFVQGLQSSILSPNHHLRRWRLLRAND
jgi:hypothetical protein